jgi:hypothetical protein
LVDRQSEPNCGRSQLRNGPILTGDERGNDVSVLCVSGAEKSNETFNGRVMGDDIADGTERQHKLQIGFSARAHLN